MCLYFKVHKQQTLTVSIHSNKYPARSYVQYLNVYTLIDPTNYCSVTLLLATAAAPWSKPCMVFSDLLIQSSDLIQSSKPIQPAMLFLYQSLNGQNIINFVPVYTCFYTHTQDSILARIWARPQQFLINNVSKKRSKILVKQHAIAIGISEASPPSK